jgi:hypothetical protein
MLMFLSFFIFFFFLFLYNFSVPLSYKEFWLFFINQFYFFVPLRFIVLLLLSIKLIISQNMRGLIPSPPGFFILLLVLKSLIKTNVITIVLMANEGLYIFENITKIIRRIDIYKLQFFFLTIFLILLLSFPFQAIIIILNFVISSFIIVHAIINYKKLKKTLKIAFLIKKRYVQFIKLKISIWIKQNILLSIYIILLLLIYFYCIYSTNNMLIDEIISLKYDMLEYCVENIFLFSFCYLYRPKVLKRNFFIAYTERLGSIHLKYYISDINKAKDDIRNKCIKISKKGNYISRNNIDVIKNEHINKNKPIIILNPRLLSKKKNTQKYPSNKNDNSFIENGSKVFIGNIQ